MIMFIHLNKRAQSTAEYVIVLGLVVGAVVAMQLFVKRGLNGRIAEAVNHVDNGPNGTYGFLTGKQYEPYYLAGSNFNTASNSNSSEMGSTGSAVNRTSNSDTVRMGTQNIGAAEDETTENAE
jgi:hypothetical protein